MIIRDEKFNLTNNTVPCLYISGPSTLNSRPEETLNIEW